jgi:hypothetical protein
MTIQANQGFGVSVFGAVSGGGGGGGGGTPGGLDTQVQFNSSGSFGASAAFTFVSPALTIGAQQSTQGQIVFANTAAGAFATTVQSSNSASAAWTLTLPATAGTANYALTTNGSGVSSWSQISLTAGVTGVLPLANGGTNANLTASNGGIIYSGASAFAVLAGTATAGQMLRSGASGAPSWSTATFPSTATSTGTLLRADGTNWAATTATYPTTTVAGTLLTSATADTVSASATPTLGVAGTTAGTLALSGATSGTVTLRTAAAAGTGTIFQFPATNGASGTILTTTGSGVTTWSTATFPSTATSTGTILRADGTNWVATTATYPTTTTANQILYSSATNTVGGLTSANTSALVTNSTGVPSFTSGGTANRVLRTDGTTISFAQVGLTTDVSGTLPTANGGTGLGGASPFTSGYVPYASSASALSFGSPIYTDGSSVAIGSTSFSGKLDVRTSAQQACVFMQNTNASWAADFSLVYNPSGGGVASDLGLSARSSGDVWIKSASASGIMHLMTAGSNVRFSIDSNGNVVVNDAALATTATNGFLYIPTCAGVPTGTPTTYTGRSAIIVDTSSGAGAGRLYIRVGATWRYVDLT